jgi:branched-chain amino acid transport system substrate-binding protein
MSQHAIRVRLWAALIAIVSALAIGACGSSGSNTKSSPSGGSAPAASTPSGSTTSGGSSSVDLSSCGTDPGKVATGTPIPVGSINTKQPGTDLSDVQNMEGAYFACVNANGGVNGHPIKLYKETEETQPAQVAADAKQLVQTDHVVAISGNTSVIDCTINQKYWQSAGYNVIANGIAPECYSSPNIADANMGPRFTSDGAAQYVMNLPGVNKVVFDSSNDPGLQYYFAGVKAVVGVKHLPITTLDENVPLQNANAVALKEVDDAGPNGVIVLNFTPPDALALLQAAQKLHLQSRVKAWACDSPCNTDYLAKALGSAWNGKLFVNAETAPPDATDTPTMSLYKAILAKYGSDVSGGVGAFSQLGFIDGEILYHALQSAKPPYTVKSVNTAIQNVKDYKTGMLCTPWTYGKAPLHVANYTDWTVTPMNGEMVTKQTCTEISSADPLMEDYYKAIGVTVPANPPPQAGATG